MFVSGRKKFSSSFIIFLWWQKREKDENELKFVVVGGDDVDVEGA
jgi:hypothetical protein